MYKAMYNGVEVEFKVVKPKGGDIKEGQKVYNMAYKDAINSGAILQAKLESVMREQNLWGDAEQTKYVQLTKDISDIEYKLEAKLGLSLSQAKDLALKLVDLRSDREDLLRIKSELASQTCEGQATNARFNYLISACTQRLDGTRLFASLDDYLENGDQPLANLAAEKFLELTTGYDITDNERTEVKFLRKYHFVDEKLRLINKEGKFIDREGNAVDEFGRRVNEKGEFIDINGKVYDKDGNYVVDNNYFVDDDGNPIVDEVTLEDKPKEETDKVEENLVTSG